MKLRFPGETKLSINTRLRWIVERIVGLIESSRRLTVQSVRHSGMYCHFPLIMYFDSFEVW